MRGRTVLLFASIFVAMTASVLAQQPKPGGVLRIYQRDSPASASVHEDATYSTKIPFMSVFNNLVSFRQDAPQNSGETIEPERATSWTWSADNRTLTFTLRQDVKWYDGQPFTARDVRCTFDLLQDRGTEHVRKNPRRLWYRDVTDVTIDRHAFADILFEGQADIRGALLPARLSCTHAVARAGSRTCMATRRW